MRKCIFKDAGLAMIVLGLVTGCSGRQVHGDVESSEHADAKDQKLETMITALSRAQSRIEELDAKMASLSDKVESTRVAVDNIAGTKPVKTEAVGSAKDTTRADRVETLGESAENSPKHSVKRASSAKSILRLDTAVAEFTKSMGLFKSGKYTDAELAFNRFTETYPEHVLAGSAQFYAGESYFMMGEYKLALNEYGKVISSFASSPRVPSAMVRLAHCYEASGNSAEAAHTMSLARQLYVGHPSLDLPPPAARSSQPRTDKPDLDAAPIEPRAHETAAH